MTTTTTGTGTAGLHAPPAAATSGWRSVPARLHAWLVTRSGPSDRGDVPGWVLITLMTAGLVTALWLVAGPLLEDVFDSAISSVKGPKP